MSTHPENPNDNDHYSSRPPSSHNRQETPEVPLTTEGYSVLHPNECGSAGQPGERCRRNKVRQSLRKPRQYWVKWNKDPRGNPRFFSLIGHKGDLMLLHFRNSFADLNQAELNLAGLRLSEYLEPTSSYLSIIELGLYDSTLKIYKELTAQSIQPHSDQWKAEIECKLGRHREAMHPRLFP